MDHLLPNTSILQISHKQFFTHFAYPSYQIHHYAKLTLIPVCIVLNLICFLIWKRPALQRENTSAMFIVVLSFSDMLATPISGSSAIFKYYEFTMLDYYYVCEIRNFFELFFMYFSTPLVFGFTINRYFTIAYPFSIGRFFTKKNNWGIIIGLMCLTIVAAASQCHTNIYLPENGSCELDNRKFFNLIFSWETLYTIVFPVIILIVNILVIHTLRGILKKGRELTVQRSTATNKTQNPTASSTTIHRQANTEELVPNKAPSWITKARPVRHKYTLMMTNSATGNSAVQQQQQTTQSPPSRNQLNQGASSRTRSTTDKPEENSKKRIFNTTLTLLMVSSILIITVLPNGIIYSMQSFEHPHYNVTIGEINVEPSWQKFILLLQVNNWIAAFSLMHYFINFFIYLCTSAVFRRELIAMFTKCCGRHNNSSMYSALPKRAVHTARIHQNKHFQLNSPSKLTTTNSNCSSASPVASRPRVRQTQTSIFNRNNDQLSPNRIQIEFSTALDRN